MKKTIKLSGADLRGLIDDVIIEGMLTEDVPPPASSAASLGSNRPLAPQQKQGGGQKGPNLKGFKADVGMAVDAASRCKQILDSGQGNTKEALRWLDKMVQFAQSAKKNLGVG